jgi:hypothetical protein
MGSGRGQTLFPILGFCFLISCQGARAAAAGAAVVGGAIKAVATDGSRVFAGAGARLLVFSPDAGAEAGYSQSGATLPLDDLVRGIAVRDGRAYVAAGTAGLLVFDVSRSGDPRLIASLKLAGHAEGVALSGNLTLVAAGPLGLRLIDVSDPARPFETACLFEGSYANAVAVRDNLAFVAAGGAGLLIADIAKPGAPRALGAAQTPGHAAGVVLAGDFALVMNSWAGISAVNVADPAHPAVAATTAVPGWAVKGVLTGTELAVACAYGGVRLFDVTDPLNPAELSHDEPFLGDVSGVVFDGERVWAADEHYGLRYLSLEPLAAHPVYDTFTGGWAVAFGGNYAYVAALDRGMRVIDISDPAQPREVAAYTAGYAMDVAINGSYVYLVVSPGDDTAGFHVVDVSDPLHPKRAGFLSQIDMYLVSQQGNPRNLTAVGDVAYVTNDQGVWIIDCSDPTKPRVLGSAVMPPVGPGLGVAVRDQVMYVAQQGSGLLTYDVSDPSAPGLLGRDSRCEAAQDVDLTGSYAMLAAMGGSCIVDISDPAHPRTVADHLTTGRGANGTAGARVYLQTTGTGIQALDLTKPSAPALLWQYSTPGYPRKVQERDGRLWIIDVEAGLWSIPLASLSQQSAPQQTSDENPVRGRRAVRSEAPPARWPQRPPLLPVNVPLARRTAAAKSGGARRATQTSCVVSNDYDAGAGSLTACLNSIGPGGVVTFDPAVFPPESPRGLLLMAPLPPLAQGGVTIDGSDAGVVLDGVRLGASDVGLTVVSDGNVISGLGWMHFAGTAILVSGGARNNTIGGDRTLGTGPNGRGNTLRDCKLGIVVSGQGTNENVLIGNYLSTTPDGIWGAGWAWVSVPDVRACVVIGAGAQANRVGSPIASERNVFGVCSSPGALLLTGAGTSDNIVIGNYIGVNASGTERFLCGDQQYCSMQGSVMINYGASRNRIGGTAPGERNVISGAAVAGINVSGLDSFDNMIVGNYIGTDASGKLSIPNGWFDIWLDSVVSRTRVEGNLISGTAFGGIALMGNYHVIIGNTFGTDASGRTALEVRGGIYGYTDMCSMRRNRIGGAAPGEGNLVSGSISLFGPGTEQNYIIGNRVGVDPAGAPLAPGDPTIPGALISISDGGKRTSIGGSSDAEGNVIGGSSGDGVSIGGGMAASFIGHNWIGIDPGGAAAGNHGSGIGNGAAPVFILKNRVAGNGPSGVQSGSGVATVRVNSIHDNAGLGILLGGSNFRSAPVIATASGTVVRGTACARCLIEIYSDKGAQGGVFEGSVTADAEGAFSFTKTAGFAGPNVTATATLPDGITTQFSTPVGIGR